MYYVIVILLFLFKKIYDKHFYLCINYNKHYYHDMKNLFVLSIWREFYWLSSLWLYNDIRYYQYWQLGYVENMFGYLCTHLFIVSTSRDYVKGKLKDSRQGHTFDRIAIQIERLRKLFITYVILI